MILFWRRNPFWLVGPTLLRTWTGTGGGGVVPPPPSGVTEDQRLRIGTVQDIEAALLYSNIGGGELSGN